MAVSLLDDEHLTLSPAGRVLRRFAVWSVLCFFGALPSFALAIMAGPPAAAMLLGVAIFVVLLTAVSCTESFNQWKRKPASRKAIRITFMFRLAMTLFFPIGWIPDLMAGILSLSLARDLAPAAGLEDGQFTLTLVATLLQGTILLGLLLVLLFLVHATVARSTPVPEHLQGLCLGCGYDMRGSGGHGVCPECGAVVEKVPVKPVVKAEPLRPPFLQ